MSNSTLLRADRATHLKIIVISVVAGMLVVGVGLTSRPPGVREAVAVDDNAIAPKSEPSLTVTSRETGAIR